MFGVWSRSLFDWFDIRYLMVTFLLLSIDIRYHFIKLNSFMATHQSNHTTTEYFITKTIRSETNDISTNW